MHDGVEIFLMPRVWVVSVAAGPIDEAHVGDSVMGVAHLAGKPVFVAEGHDERLQKELVAGKGMAKMLTYPIFMSKKVAS